ncbi:MAG: DUF5801 repeats-in-toxin domain-containing protein, partial [Erythrobacter sp.]
MMDFTGRGHADGGLENLEDPSGELGQVPADLLAQASLGAQQTLVVGPDNVVRLPAGVSLDALSVDGRDLVITLEDGSVIRIPDGAIIVPQFEVDGVTVPPQNIAALLTGSEPAPEAGAVQSSGGNFAGEVGDIQAAYGLGDLLPYTELAFPEFPDREIIPDIVDEDEQPTIVIVTPDNPAGAVNATAQVNEAGLPARNGEPEGSNSASDAEITTGTIVFTTPDGFASLTINGVAVSAVGQTIAGEFGTLTITAIGDGQLGYSYALTDNTLSPEVDSFAVTVTEVDGDTASATLDISIIDDVPDAVDEVALTIVEDDPAGLSGNVIDNDVEGADGARVTSVNIGGTDYAIAASGTTPVVTANGAYTFDALGNWTFDPNPGLNQSDGPIDASFTYTLSDGDGDSDTAVQPISIADGAGPADPAPIVLPLDDQNLADGSTPAGVDFAADTLHFVAGSDPFASFAFGDTSGLLGGLTWVRVDDTTITGSDGGRLVVTLTLSVSGDDATVTAVLNDNYLGHPGIDIDDLAMLGSVEVIATDTDGDTATGGVLVRVSDDLPDALDEGPRMVAEDAVGTIGGDVTANDSAGADGARVTSFTVGGVTTQVPQDGSAASYANANGTYTLTMSGVWTFDPNPGLDQSDGPIDASFSYTLSDGDGDSDTAVQPISITDGGGPVAGEPVSLTVDDQNLADGSDPATPVTDSAMIAFTPGSDAIVSIVFDDSATALDNLDGGLSWERVSDTQIVGRSGEEIIVTLDLSVTGSTATVTVTLSDNYALHPGLGDDLAALGSVLVVATDLDGDQASSSVSVSVSDDLPTLAASAPEAGSLAVDESVFGTDAMADFSGLFTPDYNADGPGSVSGYTLGVAAGSTGLVDTLSGEAVVLSLEGGAVVGRTETGGEVVFVLTVDASGIVTLDQQRAVVHADTTDHDDPAGLADPDLITLSATVTDGDGDTATATASLGGALSLRDDGPAIDASAVDGDAIVLTTQDADTIGAASDTDTTTADFGASFSIADSSFGADGAGGIAWSYAFVLDGPDSGLTSNGVGVTLAFEGADIVGSANGTEVFRLSVDPATGVVTLTQYQEIDHALPGESSAPYDDQLAVLADGALSLQGTATITDGDGDQASETVSLDLGGNIRFADDGPTVTTRGESSPLVVDDTTLSVDADTDYSDRFVFDFGADGAASGGGESYALGVGAGSSGLTDTLTGEAVVLTLEGGQVVGR